MSFGAKVDILIVLAVCLTRAEIFQGRHAHPRYSHKYIVNDPHTGYYKNQWETRDGDVVEGSNGLLDPDGTIRHVEYTADKHSGFNAVARKIGKTIHPIHHSSTSF